MIERVEQELEALPTSPLEQTSGNFWLIETLRVHVKEHAGPWKYPRWIDVRPDLPRTATGKIQRFKLRELES